MEKQDEEESVGEPDQDKDNSENKTEKPSHQKTEKVIIFFVMIAKDY